MRNALMAAGLVSSEVSTVAAFAIQDDVDGFEGEERRSHQLLVQDTSFQWEYKEPILRHNVEVRIPKAGGLELKTEQLVDGRTIPAHYHHVKKFDGVIINFHYYDINPGDFGRLVTATFEIIDKVKNDRCFTFINIRKTGYVAPEWKVKYMPDFDGILLAGTGHSVHFIPT